MGSEDLFHPEREELLAASIGPAMPVVLETLSPAERLRVRPSPVFHYFNLYRGEKRRCQNAH